MTALEKILFIMKEKGIKQTYIEGLIDGYRGKVTEWKKNKSRPTVEELQIITKALYLPDNFLFDDSTGVEFLELNSTPITNEKGAAFVATFNEQQIISSFRGLSPRGKEYFMQQLRLAEVVSNEM